MREGSDAARIDSRRDPILREATRPARIGYPPPPTPPRRPPIRTLGTALVLTLLTALAAIAGWAGLYAWQLPTPRYSGPVAPVAMPEPVATAALRFPDAPARTVSASVPLGSGARPATGEVHVRVEGGSGTEWVTLLDGATAGVLAQEPVGSRGEVTFGGIPVGTHTALVHPPGVPPRQGYLAKAPVELSAALSPRETSITLDARAQDTVVLVERTDLPSHPTWHATTAVLHRVDDPLFCALPEGGVSRTFEPGSADVVFEFDALGPGRYRVAFDGFAPAQPIEFEVPGEPLQFVLGATQRVRTEAPR
ncbi:MAG: hypothetical protein ACO3UM_04385 [Planctomycetota bacterium]